MHEDQNPHNPTTKRMTSPFAQELHNSYCGYGTDKDGSPMIEGKADNPPTPDATEFWCQSCGAVFTPPQKCDCERAGMSELANHTPQNSSTDMKVWLDVRENATGVVVRHPRQWIFGGDYVWSEGNFSCDCNRTDFFVQGQSNDLRAEAGDVPCSDDRYSIRLTNAAGEVVYEDDDWEISR